MEPALGARNPFGAGRRASSLRHQLELIGPAAAAQWRRDNHRLGWKWRYQNQLGIQLQLFGVEAAKAMLGTAEERRERGLLPHFMPRPQGGVRLQPTVEAGGMPVRHGWHKGALGQKLPPGKWAVKKFVHGRWCRALISGDCDTLHKDRVPHQSYNMCLSCGKNFCSLECCKAWDHEKQ